MMRIFSCLLAFSLFLSSIMFAQSPTFTLKDFYTRNSSLHSLVIQHFNTLSPGERVAQLLMPAIGHYGQPEETIDRLVRNKKIGGILLLDGTKKEFTQWVKRYTKINTEIGSLPFLYSADAEPSLFNRKIKNTTPVKGASKMSSKKEVIAAAETIAKELNEIGINYNFAPVVDRAANGTVGWRGFGKYPDSIDSWSLAFIQVMQEHNIIATAKHFPGHGLVEGDSHKALVYIKGKMKEVKNYPPLIQNGVLSILVAHIAVENNPQFNTHGNPSSISPKIITELLRDSLQFKGLVITDAMNMKGVSTIENSAIKAIKAGADILLMPPNAGKLHDKILKKYNSNSTFQEKVNHACKRIIRAKLCLEKEQFPSLK